MAAPAWLRTGGRILLLPLKIIAGAVIAIVLLAILVVGGAAYLLLRLLTGRQRPAAPGTRAPARAASTGPATVIDISAEAVAPPVVLPRAPRASRWSMPDADPYASRSLDVAGPSEGKLLWTFDTGPAVEGLHQPIETAEGNLICNEWWVKGDHGPKLIVVDPGGALVREIVPSGWTCRGLVAGAGGTVYLSAGATLEARDAAGSQLWRQDLERSPDLIRLSPGGELCLFISERALYCYSTDGKLIRKVAMNGRTWQSGYFAFDGAGNLYTGESDSWRGDPDDCAEQFSRVAGFSGDGFLRFGHTLTAPDATDAPYSQVRHVWGLAEAAVFFGHPRIQCYDPVGAAVWEVANARELAGDASELPEFSVRLSRDPRLAGAPYLVNLARGSMDYIECAGDRDGNAYFTVPNHVISVDADCRPRWSVRLPAEHLHDPMLTTGGLLVVTGNGNLYAIG